MNDWKWPLGKIALIALEEHLKNESIPYHQKLNGDKEELINAYKQKIEKVVNDLWK